MTFEPGLADNLATGDANYLSVLDEADAYVARNGLDLPEEPEARVMAPDPDCVTDPILSLDLAAEGITSIVWATGYALDFGWLKVDAFDEPGKPKHQRGVSAEPGRLLPRPALAVAAGLVLHLGRLARREVRRRPHRHAAQLPGVPRAGEPRAEVA